MLKLIIKEIIKMTFALTCPISAIQIMNEINNKNDNPNKLIIDKKSK